MKQLHFGNSNSLYKQEGSVYETMFELVVTGMAHTCFTHVTGSLQHRTERGLARLGRWGCGLHSFSS